MIEAPLSYEIVESHGDVPEPRFGHTITLTSKDKAILFGGAVGDANKYQMTADTYLFHTVKRVWKKLTPKGIVPSPRAAHASVLVEPGQFVMYSGASGSGILSTDDLFLFIFDDEANDGQWQIIQVTGSTPGKRYGHTMTFCLPYLTIFGGNNGADTLSDTWCLNIEKQPFMWEKVAMGSEIPPPRVYHAAANCLFGAAAGIDML